LANPPAKVHLVMEALGVLFGMTDLSWGALKRDLLSKNQLLDSIKNYDKDNIAPATIKKLQPYIKDPGFNKVSV